MSQVKQVFISHGKSDSILAHRLAEDLKGLGMKVWIAPESIKPGEGWVKAINRGLSESSHMVTVLTPSTLKSKWVNMETEVAIDMERKGQLTVILLDVKPCKLPDLWNYYQRIPFHEDYEKGLRQLESTLKLGKKLAPTPTPPPPKLEPEPSPEPPPPRFKMSEILERVREYVAWQFDIHISHVRPETNLIYDLNADDTDLEEIRLGLEEKFDIDIHTEESFDWDTKSLKLPTVRDWAAYIYQCMQG